MPSHARPPDRTSSVVVAFTQSAGVAVVDAADHQAKARPRGMRGHEAERGHALEHRLLGRADAADLEEVVHDPDRVEADVVGLADDAGEGRADRLGPAGPRERRDLDDRAASAERSGFSARWPIWGVGRRGTKPQLRIRVDGRDDIPVVYACRMHMRSLGRQMLAAVIAVFGVAESCERCHRAPGRVAGDQRHRRRPVTRRRRTASVADGLGRGCGRDRVDMLQRDQRAETLAGAMVAGRGEPSRRGETDDFRDEGLSSAFDPAPPGSGRSSGCISICRRASQARARRTRSGGRRPSLAASAGCQRGTVRVRSRNAAVRMDEPALDRGARDPPSGDRRCTCEIATRTPFAYCGDTEMGSPPNDPGLLSGRGAGRASGGAARARVLDRVTRSRRLVRFDGRGPLIGMPWTRGHGPGRPAQSSSNHRQEVGASTPWADATTVLPG